MTTTGVDDRPVTLRRRGISIAFYSILSVTLLLMMAGMLDVFLPDGVAGRLGRNSESVCYVLLLGLWIQFGIPRLRAGSVPRWLPAVVAVVLVGAGFGLLASDFPSTVRTLNEPVIAAGVLVAYVSIRRPLPRWAAVVAALVPLAIMTLGVVLALPAAGERMQASNIAIQQAEMIVLVFLTIVALDFVDTGIIDDKSVTRRPVRLAFYAFLVATPVVVTLLGGEARVGSDFSNLVLNVLGRSHEAFIGVIVLCLYFAFGLGRTGRSSALPSGPDK